MCHSEFGPGTEYGCQIAVTPLHQRAELRGSTCLIEVRTLRRVTIYPLACSCPIRSTSPMAGKSLRICLTISNS